jgi:hypothetical protein
MHICRRKNIKYLIPDDDLELCNVEMSKVTGNKLSI